MFSHKRMVEILKTQAGQVNERYPGYRVAVAKALMQIIALQNESGSEKGRRERVAKEVGALAGKAVVEKEE